MFLPGLAPVWDALESGGGETHLLIGNTARQPTDEQRVAGREAEGALGAELDVARGARAERARVVTETAEALRANLAHIPRTDENARFLLGMARGIAVADLQARLKVRHL